MKLKKGLVKIAKDFGMGFGKLVEISGRCFEVSYFGRDSGAAYYFCQKVRGCFRRDSEQSPNIY